MDDKKIDEDYELGSGFLREFDSSINGSNTGLTIAQQAVLKAKAAVDEDRDRNKKIEQYTQASITGLLNFGKTLSAQGPSGGFGGLNAVIDAVSGVAGSVASMVPIIGDALESMAKQAGEMAKFLVNQFKKAYGNFEKLSDTGVVTTFKDLKDTADYTGLNLDDTNKVFGKYSTDLATFGGSAVAGRKAIMAITMESSEVTRDFQILGMAAADVAELQIGSLKQIQASAEFDINDTTKLSEFSKKNILRLDTLSKLTGKGRKELQAEILERGRSARYSAGIATLAPDLKGEVDEALGQLSSLDKEFGEGMVDLISSSGRPVTEKAQNNMMALQLGGQDVVGDIQKLKSGQITGAEYNKRTTEALAKYSDIIKDDVKKAPAGMKINANFIAGAEAKIKSQTDSVKTQEAVNDETKKWLEATTGTGKKLANTRRNLYETSKSIELLATSSDLVAGAMDATATAISKGTKILYGAMGKKLPVVFQMRVDELESIEALNKEKLKLSDKTQQQRTKIQKLNELQKDPTKNASRIEELKNEIKQDDTENKLLEIQIEEKEEKIKQLREARQKKENLERFGSETAPGAPGSTSSNSTSSNAGAPGAAPGTSGGTPVTESAGGMPAGAAPTTVGQNQQLLLQAMNDLGVTDAKTRAAMAATAEGESGFKLQNEISYENTANQNIRKSFGAGSVFGKMSDDQLTKVKKDPVQFFDIVYGGRYGNTSPGDGYKYRGRGFIGITFKDNYAKYGKLLGIDLVGNPDLANDPKIAAKIAVMMMKDGMAANKRTYGNADTYTQVARSIGNANKVTEDRKKNMYAQNLQSGQWGPDKTADLSFIDKQPVPASVATGSTFPKSRTGGIISGPSTGYIAILHGDEMVIPANEGSSKMQVESMMGNSVDQESVIKLFTMMNRKFDRMISSVQSDISTELTSKMVNA